MIGCSLVECGKCLGNISFPRKPIVFMISCIAPKIATKLFLTRHPMRMILSEHK